MGWIMIFFCAGLMCLGGAFILTKLLLLVVFGGILLGIAVFLLLGLKDVQEQERIVVELFGKYFMTLRPGLQWLLRGAMKIRASISVWEQEIPLFHDAPASLDLKDGTVVPEGAKVFVKLRDPDREYTVVKIPEEPGKKSYKIVYKEDKEKDKEIDQGKLEKGAYRAIYEVPDWREFIEDRIENALRSYLNELTIDEVLTAAKAGFNLADRRENVGLPNHQLDAIEGDLALWGFDLLRITITDFELPKEILQARDLVQIRKREAEAALSERKKMARETMGSLIQMIAEATGVEFEVVQQQVGTDPQLREKLTEFGKELITRRMSLDAKALIDIRTGGGELENGLMRLIAGFSVLSRSKGGGEKKKEEKEEKKE